MFTSMRSQPLPACRSVPRDLTTAAAAIVPRARVLREKTEEFNTGKITKIDGQLCTQRNGSK